MRDVYSDAVLAHDALREVLAAATIIADLHNGRAVPCRSTPSSTKRKIHSTK